MALTTASIKSSIVELSKLLAGKSFSVSEIQEKWNSLVGEKLKIKQIEIEIESDDETEEQKQPLTTIPITAKPTSVIKTCFAAGDKVKMIFKKGYYAAVIGKLNLKHYTVWTCKNSLSPTAVIYKYTCPINLLRYTSEEEGMSEPWNFHHRLTGEHIPGRKTHAVVKTGYSVSVPKCLSMSSGIAYTSTMFRDGKNIGTIQNGGTGGPTYVNLYGEEKTLWTSWLKAKGHTEEDGLEELISTAENGEVKKTEEPSKIGYDSISQLHDYVKKWVKERYARGYTTVSAKNSNEILVELEDLRHGDHKKMVLKASGPVGDLVKRIQQALPRAYGRTPGLTDDFDYTHPIIIKGGSS